MIAQAAGVQPVSLTFRGSDSQAMPALCACKAGSSLNLNAASMPYAWNAAPPCGWRSPAAEERVPKHDGHSDQGPAHQHRQSLGAAQRVSHHCVRHCERVGHLLSGTRQGCLVLHDVCLVAARDGA